jgi:hypothetical protein
MQAAAQEVAQQPEQPAQQPGEQPAVQPGEAALAALVVQAAAWLKNGEGSP